MNARTEFPTETVESPGLRRAALTLHATAAADRAWLLAQLPVAHRAALETMLSELASLGVPPDRQFTQRLLAQAAAPKRASAPVEVRVQAEHEWLASVHARDLAAVLHGEPAALAAHVVQLLPVQRRQAVLALLAGPQRRQVNELLHAHSGPAETAAPRFTQALLAELRARLPQHGRYDAWHRLLQRLRLPRRNGAAA